MSEKQQKGQWGRSRESRRKGYEQGPDCVGLVISVALGKPLEGSEERSAMIWLEF